MVILCRTRRNGAHRWTGPTPGVRSTTSTRFAGATWSYIGSRFNDFAATPGATGAFEPEPRPELSSYNTVNLRAGLENGRWAFELYCKNVGDTRGITYYVNSGAPNFGGVIGYVQPRTLGGTVTARF